MAPAFTTATRSTFLERQVDRPAVPRVVASILFIFILSLIGVGLMGGIPLPRLAGRFWFGRLLNMEALSDSITAWLTYKKQVEEAPEWPYTTDTLRNLLVSTLVPVLAWAAQIIVEYIT